MNRNHLKIIAVISMLVDHIGLYFFPEYIVFRCVGRLAYVIFAFFIAEGWKKTKNKKKYLLLLFVFALISQIPYSFLGEWWKLNTLFTFLISIALIWLIENIKNYKLAKISGIIFIVLVMLALEVLGVFDYGVLGVALVVVFYFFKTPWKKYLLAGICLVMLGLRNILIYGFEWKYAVQFLSVLTLPILMLYNGEKGRLNLKYLFYVFYPTHLALIVLILNLIK